MSKGSEAVKRWRKTAKKRIIESMGGECQSCGYSKCDEALELHHIDPDKKELSFGAIRANPKSWVKIVEELRKCILLCSNCHKEIHNDILELPEEYESFNEDYVEYDVVRTHECNLCSVCGKDKPIHNKFCSKSCAMKNHYKD